MKIKEISREFFERDGNAFLAKLREYPLVAEYSGPSGLFLWDVRDVQLFKKFKQSITNIKLVGTYTKKDLRGLHQLKIYSNSSDSSECWIIFETYTRTIVQDLKDIYLFKI